MLTLETKSLVTALTAAKLVTPSHSKIPFLGCVRITSAPDGAQLVATDLDAELHQLVRGEGGPFDGCVPLKGLLAAVKGSKAGAFTFTVHIASQGGGAGFMMLRASDGSMESTLPLLPADDFPIMEDKPAEHMATIPAAELLASLRAVSHCASTEKTRFYLQGVYLHARAWNGVSRIVMAATDGHKLALCALPGEGWDMPGAIVPTLVVKTLESLLVKAKGTVVTWAGVKAKTAARMTVTLDGTTRLVFRTVDGTFPEYARVIPSGADKRATLPRKPLAAAVQGLVKIMRAEGDQVKLRLTLGATAQLRTTSHESSAVRSVPCAWSEDAALDVGFNGTYLLAMCERTTSESLELKLAAADSPVLLRQPGNDDWLGILMPMRL